MFYCFRWDSRSPSPQFEDVRQRETAGGRGGPGYNEYVNYPWEDYDSGGERGRAGRPPRLSRATSSRDSGYYGGMASLGREEEAGRAARRREAGRLAGRGWSQTSVADRSARKLPRTPHSAINAMAALQVAQAGAATAQLRTA